ncbi:beta strand repeat-containing protein [Oscillibacter sp. GMB15532]|uniref:beta strand repeat-containing protein n=1 Tax=Oscillibacter sp. GMB15532 TaxID=3230022 RepID=UPI0034DF03C4
MKKRIFSVFLAVGLLPVLTLPALAGLTPISIGESSLYFKEDDDGAMKYSTDNTNWIEYGSRFIITGSSTSDGTNEPDVTNTVVVLSGEHNIILSDCSIGAATPTGSANSYALSPFDIQGTARVNLTLDGNNKLYSANYEKAGLHVASGAALEIFGEGSLEAYCRKQTGFGAGIGGNSIYGTGESNGSITISGGTVSAYSFYGAGIGSGRNQASFGPITISGGTVYALTENSSQGIGRGGYVTGAGNGTVTITGGSVNALCKPQFSTPTTSIASPVNGSGAAVELYTLTLPAGNENTSVTSLTTTPALTGYTYGTTDMQTDADGKLYVYLPSGKTAVSVTTANGTYTGTIASNAAPLTLAPPSYTATVTVQKDNSDWRSDTPTIQLSTSSSALENAVAGSFSSSTCVYTFSGLADGTTYYVWDATTDTYTGQSVDKTGTSATLYYYTLTLNPDAGVSSTTGGVYLPGKSVAINAVLRPGYAWSKWVDLASSATYSTVQSGNITMPASVITLMGTSTVIAYDISYELNGGTVSGTNPASYTIETADFTLNTPTRAGHSFVGWSGTALTGNTNQTVTIPTDSTGDKSYTANWKANAPSGITFSFDGDNAGKLMGTTALMEYSLNGGASYTDCTTDTDLTGSLSSITAVNDIRVWVKETTTSAAGDVLTIDITQATAPALSPTQPSTIGGSGSIPMTPEHEYSANNGGTWTSASGTMTLASGTYLVRVKATGTVLASAAQSVTLTAYTGNPATTPSASFSFDGADAGMLTGTTTQMQYSLDGGTIWINCADPSTDLSGVIDSITVGNGIKVKDMGNGSTTSESAVQSIDITQTATPALSPSQPSIIGGSGSIPMTPEHEYSANNGGTWTSASGTMTLASGTYVIRVKATGTVLASAAQSVTLTAYTGIAEATPSAGVDYAAEQLTGLTANGSYAINGADITADDTGNISIANAWFDTAISLVKKGDGTTTNDSAAQSISLTARPAAPSCTVTQPSASSATGTISGVTADMECSTDGGVIWTDGTGNDMSGLAPGTVLIRVKAISSSAPAGMSQSITITAYSAPSHPGSGGGSSAAPVTSTTTSAPVIVGGKTENIGTEKKSGGTTTVTVDQSKLGTNIGGAASGSSVVVPVSGNSSATASLVVKNIEDMAAKSMTLTVQTGNVAYNLNTSAIDTGALTEAFPGADMSKVPFEVTITNSSVRVQGETLVLSPVEFTVTASYNGKTVSVDAFSAYVNRVIEVTAEQAEKITTAVVVNTDGSVRHVPTNVVEKDGRYYAIINSCTNSTYALIQNEVTFADAAGKWFETAANEMGSRKIIAGRSADIFDGGASITRAEFVVILVRALGLPANGTSGFSDVPAGAWYSGAAATAAQYGIVSGKSGNRFDPNAAITRQEAMVMLQRAAVLAGFAGTSGDLDGFADADSVGSWARDAAEWNVGSGLIQSADGKLNPTASITRAQSAVVILRLLQNAELVDVRS